MGDIDKICRNCTSFFQNHIKDQCLIKDDFIPSSNSCSVFYPTNEIQFISFKRKINKLESQLADERIYSSKRVLILEDELNTAISALKHLRHMDTWQNVRQINDFLDETLKEVE